VSKKAQKSENWGKKAQMEAKQPQQ